MTFDAKRQRLQSLDILRGLTVMGMILVNSSAEVFYSLKVPVFPTLLHSHWNGLQFADTVFPAFLMMVGVAIPMSLAMGGGTPRLSEGVGRKIAMRTVRIVILGIVLSNIRWLANFHVGDWRLFGVLQRIGLAYGACAMLFLMLDSRKRMVLIILILGLYWPLMMLPAYDGLPYDIMLRGHNFAGAVDRFLLGAGNHNYVAGPEGYDPEGLIGTLPAIAHGLIGVAIGEFLQRNRGRNVAGQLAIAGIAMVIAGSIWSLAFPIIKDIWSSSFVLVTCGLTTIALAAVYALVDRNGPAPPRWPATIALVFGGNAIAAYILHMVTGSMLLWDAVLVPFHAGQAVLPAPVASLIPVSIYMTFLWLCIRAIHTRGWILKL